MHTWLAIVGPGVRHEGVTNALFTDHADIRPTVLSLAGLTDDYAHDGRVIFEIMHDQAMPSAVRRNQEILHRLAAAYKNINAPVGPLGLRSLEIATAGVESTDARYAKVTQSIQDLTAARNAIAGAMISLLEGAAFSNKAVDAEEAERLIDAADELLERTR